MPYGRRDIHEDPEAAAFVRSVNDGDETVPTAVIDGTDVRVNPKPADLLRALGVAPAPTLWDKFSGGRTGLRTARSRVEGLNPATAVLPGLDLRPRWTRRTATRRRAPMARPVAER